MSRRKSGASSVEVFDCPVCDVADASSAMVDRRSGAINVSGLSGSSSNITKDISASEVKAGNRMEGRRLLGVSALCSCPGLG